jgi:hypothetical protein
LWSIKTRSIRLPKAHSSRVVAGSGGKRNKEIR